MNTLNKIAKQFIFYAILLGLWQGVAALKFWPAYVFPTPASVFEALQNGFSDQFVLHMAETKHDLERLTPAMREKIRGVAVTYHTVHADKTALRIQDGKMMEAIL